MKGMGVLFWGVLIGFILFILYKEGIIHFTHVNEINYKIENFISNIQEHKDDIVKFIKMLLDKIT